MPGGMRKRKRRVCVSARCDSGVSLILVTFKRPYGRLLIGEGLARTSREELDASPGDTK